MLRCNECILPDNYPGIKFNKNGICNYCTNHKEKKYLGGNVTTFKENTIEIFQSKKKKKMSVAGFYTDENGREVVRW